MEGHCGNHSPQRINQEKSADMTGMQGFTNLCESWTQQAAASSKQKFRYILKPVDFEKDSKVRWNSEENFFLIELYIVYGANWSVISGFFNDRSEFSVKNHFYNLKKRLPRDERMRINQERKAYKERRYQLTPCEPELNLVAKDYEDMVVDSFFADNLNTNTSQNLNEKCLTSTFYDTNMDIQENGEEGEPTNERIFMLKKFSKIVERQLALKKAKVLNTLI